MASREEGGCWVGCLVVVSSSRDRLPGSIMVVVGMRRRNSSIMVVVVMGDIITTMTIITGIITITGIEWWR
jgi:hypothetical protein